MSGKRRANLLSPAEALELARVWAKAAKTAEQRARRLVIALSRDLERAEDAGALRQAGEVLKIQAKLVPRGADRVVLSFPWLQDEPIEVPLQRDLSPQANADRLFRRARGLERAKAEISTRWDDAVTRQAALADWPQRLVALQGALQAEIAPIVVGAEGSSLDACGPGSRADELSKAVQEAVKALHGLGVKPPQRPPETPPKSRAAAKAALPEGVQRFVTARGVELLVGRSAKANDALVTRLSRGADVWLHVRDQTGAHGLLRCGKHGSAHPGDLAEAATLVAWLSGVERGGWADVSWTEARHVRKGKGLPPGAVYVQQERVVRVEVIRAVVDAAYARRDASPLTLRT